MADNLWIRDHTGAKAYIDPDQRDRWIVHGWTETLPPADGEFVWMSHPDIGQAGNPIPWNARDYWQAIGWQPGAPPEPVDLTRDHLAAPEAEQPPDGTKDDVLAWVGDDRGRAEQALAVEQSREKPRTTLVDALGRVGQPEQDISAAPAASSTEE